MRFRASHALKLTGVLLFLFIVSRLDLRQIAVNLSAASPLPLLLAFGLFPAIYLLKAARWHLLLRRAGIRQPFEESFRMYCAALFLGTVTPGNLGEAAKIAFLRSKGNDLKTATLATVLDRLYDMVWIGLFAIPSLALLLSDRLPLWTVILCLIILCFLGGSLILRKSMPQNRHLLLWWKPHALTVANWAVYYLQLLMIARAFDLRIPLLPFFGIMTIAGIANLLAIAGLGTREATLLFFFQRYGIAPTLTVAFSLSVFALTITASLLGAYFWMSFPLHNHAKDPR